MKPKEEKFFGCKKGETVKLNIKEAKCLNVLRRFKDSDVYCLYFKTIMNLTGLDRKTVRRCVRSLERKGMAKYVRGLFNMDGEVAGSGYCAVFKDKSEEE